MCRPATTFAGINLSSLPRSEETALKLDVLKTLNAFKLPSARVRAELLPLYVSAIAELQGFLALFLALFA